MLLLLIVVLAHTHTREENRQKLSTRVRFDVLLENAGSCARRQGEGPSYVTAENGCLFVRCCRSVVLRPFSRCCRLCAWAATYQRARVSNFRSRTRPLSTFASRYLPAAGLMATPTFTIPPPSVHS